MTQPDERKVEPALRAYRGIAWLVGVLLITFLSPMVARFAYPSRAFAACPASRQLCAR